MKNATQHQTYGIKKIQSRLEAGQFPGYGKNKDAFYRCDVIFGSPSADCRGTGICKITASGQTQAEATGSSCKTTRAIFARHSGDDHISLLLFPEFLCIHVLRNHLRNGVLQLTEPCPLPEGLVKQLNLEFTRLEPGHYPVETKLGYLKIDFNQASTPGIG